MPKYRVELDGRAFTFEGDHPPTEAEARAAIASLDRPTPTPATSQPETRVPLFGVPVVAQDVATGVLKGLGSTAVGLGQLVHQIPGVSKAVDALYGTPGLSEDAFSEAHKALRPTGTAQKIGFTGEQIGEFFVPGAAPEKLTARIASKTPRIVARAAAEGAVAGGIGAAQEGDIKGAALPGALAAGVPVAGAIVGPIVKRIAETPLRRMIKVPQPTTGALKDIEGSLAQSAALHRGFGNNTTASVVKELSRPKALTSSVSDYKAALHSVMTQLETNIGLPASRIEAIVQTEGLDGLKKAIQTQIDSMDAFIGPVVNGKQLPYNNLANVKAAMKRIYTLKEAINVLTGANLPKGAGVLGTGLPAGAAAVVTGAFNPLTIASGMTGLALTRSPRAAMAAALAGKAADKALTAPATSNAIVASTPVIRAANQPPEDEDE